MAEYIEREAAKRAVEAALELTPSEFDSVVDEIDRVPTDDVAPVVHGRWNRPFLSGTKRKNPFCYCTNCAYPVQPKWASNYCPSCGAKMDLEG